MTTKKAGRPLRVVREPFYPKAEIQAGEVWGEQAAMLLKQVMESRGWGFRQLSEELATVGAEMTAPAVNRRINRGTFTAGFLLMCLEAMGAKLEVRYGDATTDSSPAKMGSNVKEGPETLEEIIGRWADKEAAE